MPEIKGLSISERRSVVSRDALFSQGSSVLPTAALSSRASGGSTMRSKSSANLGLLPQQMCSSSR